MEDYIVKGEQEDLMFTPSVFFHAETGECRIEGESYLEDAYSLYNGALDWLKEFLDTQKKALTLKIRLTYFNTSSSRGILLLFREIAQQQRAGKNIKVIWYYPVPDEDEICIEIEDLKQESDIRMDILPEQKR